MVCEQWAVYPSDVNAMGEASVVRHQVVSGLSLEEERRFAQQNWWLHDAHWFAAVARLGGEEMANQANLAAIERAARGAALQLRRRGIMSAPRTMEELERVFRIMWWLFFPEGLYQSSVFTHTGDGGEWCGTECHAFEQVRRGGHLAHYQCGCRAFREGIRKALGADFDHEIVESLMAGDGRCVVRFTLHRKG